MDFSFFVCLRSTPYHPMPYHTMTLPTTPHVDYWGSHKPSHGHTFPLWITAHHIILKPSKLLKLYNFWNPQRKTYRTTRHHKKKEHHNTLHHITLCHVIPHHGTPYHEKEHCNTSYHTLSCHTRPQHTISWKRTPQHNISHFSMSYNTRAHCIIKRTP